jgi:hypothetical protein
VAASEGVTHDDKNKIRMMKVDSNAPGVSITPMKINLVPEISHCELAFTNVTVSKSDLLSGDGYEDYIKPFRTVEDLHISAAMLGYLFRNACRYVWDREIRQRILGCIFTIRNLTLSPPGAPSVHIVTGDALRQVKELIKVTEPLWEKVSEEKKEAWNRDKVLMNIAHKARNRRLQTAWEFYE